MDKVALVRFRVRKAAMLMWVRGGGRQRIIVFGDSEVDLTLFRFTDWSCAGFQSRWAKSWF